jgi:hypothetical protein
MNNRSCWWWTVERRVTGEGEGGGIRLTYFTYLHENRAMKLVEIILGRGGI